MTLIDTVPRGDPVYVFTVGQLGDSLVALPAVHAVKEAFPDSPIVLVGDMVPGEQYLPSWEVFKLSGVFSESLYYTPMNRSKLACVAELLSISRSMRRLGGGPLFYLVNDGASVSMVRRHRFFFETICGARIIGMEQALQPYMARDGDGRLITQEPRHRKLFEIVQGHVNRPLPFRSEDLIFTDEQAEKSVEKYFSNLPQSDYVAFGPWSKMPCKRWPLERFEQVGRFLIREKGVFPVILGGANERQIGEVLLKTWEGLGLNLCGITLSESAQALRRCVMYVGNDTGAMHLAATVGVPCVAIFSCRDAPGRWHPMGDHHAVLRHWVPCEGCMLETCRYKVVRCLDGISVEQAIDSARRVLEKARCRRLRAGMA